MHNCIIYIKPRIVGTFSNSNDEVQVDSIYMDINKDLCLNLKINEALFNIVDVSILKDDKTESTNKAISQTPVKILESCCTWTSNF